MAAKKPVKPTKRESTRRPPTRAKAARKAPAAASRAAAKAKPKPATGKATATRAPAPSPKTPSPALPTRGREESLLERLRRQQSFAGVGRNDICPCGSGKRYKNCHGR